MAKSRQLEATKKSQAMRKKQSYFFVGSKELEARVEEKYEGKKINQIKDIYQWIKESNQRIENENIIATFIVNEQEELVISDRHSEHVMCAGGRNVLSAGEITFNFEKKNIFVSEITNQSTGYCPKTTSWEIVNITLSKIGIEHPKYFTKAYEFRYCENCQTKNLIKEEIYQCAVCNSDLDFEWNIYKIN